MACPWREGYRHVAAEVSPWAAIHFQRSAAEDSTPVPGLWTRKQATDVLRFAAPGQSVLWGCDIEEMQPDRLISQMAQLNPTDTRVSAMQEMVSSGTAENALPNYCDRHSLSVLLMTFWLAANRSGKAR
jgi:hypothetical protein